MGFVIWTGLLVHSRIASNSYVHWILCKKKKKKKKKKKNWLNVMTTLDRRCFNVVCSVGKVLMYCIDGLRLLAVICTMFMPSLKASKTVLIYMYLNRKALNSDIFLVWLFCDSLFQRLDCLLLLKHAPAQWLSGRASALWSGGCGFDPRPGHTKTLTLLLLSTTCPVLENSVDPDQLAEETYWSGSALFVIKCVNFYQKPRSSLISWKWEVGVVS